MSRSIYCTSLTLFFLAMCHVTFQVLLHVHYYYSPLNPYFKWKLLLYTFQFCIVFYIYIYIQIISFSCLILWIYLTIMDIWNLWQIHSSDQTETFTIVVSFLWQDNARGKNKSLEIPSRTHILYVKNNYICTIIQNPICTHLARQRGLFKRHK